MQKSNKSLRLTKTAIIAIINSIIFMVLIMILIMNIEFIFDGLVKSGLIICFIVWLLILTYIIVSLRGINLLLRKLKFLIILPCLAILLYIFGIIKFLGSFNGFFEIFIGIVMVIAFTGPVLSIIYYIWIEFILHIKKRSC